MILRPIKEEDIQKMKDLHERYFSEFEFPDFTKMMVGFIIADDDNEIVVAGGVRAVAETVIVTDKTKNLHTIGDALLEALSISRYTCHRNKIELLHAFVKDKAYERHLLKWGFTPRSKALFMKVSNG